MVTAELLLQPVPNIAPDGEDDPDDPEAVLPISGLDVVRREISIVQDARGAVTQEMMDMVQMGLETLVSLSFTCARLQPVGLGLGVKTDHTPLASYARRTSPCSRHRYKQHTTSQSYLR